MILVVVANESLIVYPYLEGLHYLMFRLVKLSQNQKVINEVERILNLFEFLGRTNLLRLNILTE